jgi:AcrR family transcriptional regulator
VARRPAAGAGRKDFYDSAMPHPGAAPPADEPVEPVRSVARLPRGRHGLPPEQVSEIQRARMLRALADAMADRGFVATSVADVIKRAGTSRETFYQQFSSKQDCFIAAYRLAAARVLEELELVAGGSGSPLERFDRSIAAYLEALASEPAFARLFMVEVYAAGDEVLASRAEIQARFVELVQDAFGARGEAEQFACEALVAAVITLVTTRLAARDIAGLRTLREPLVGLVRQTLRGLSG